MTLREHGGNIDAARARFGEGDWLDLSTGINPIAYPTPKLSERAGSALPTHSALDALTAMAGRAYGCNAPIAATAGAQAAIQALPYLTPPGPARILSPTYNEYEAVFRTAGRQVELGNRLADLEGAAVAVVVNPNNPDGRRHAPDELLALLKTIGCLIVDESFADTAQDCSLAGHVGTPNLLVLKSFGKFYGLAGVRLGFVLSAREIVTRFKDFFGPWPICGAAIEIGVAALADDDWRASTRGRLRRDAKSLDDLGVAAGWEVVGGTDLFRLYDVGDAQAVQTLLAREKIWTRRFEANPRWLRLGLPGVQKDWRRLGSILAEFKP